jgi:hypothetical protein
MLGDRKTRNFRSGAASILRGAMALVVLVCFLQLQIHSVTHIHGQGEPNSHCCPACHATYPSILQAFGGPQLLPPALAEWRMGSEDPGILASNTTAFHSPRAPPV